jgi:hypothetical protein
LWFARIHDTPSLAAGVDNGAIGRAASQHCIRPERVLHSQRLFSFIDIILYYFLKKLSYFQPHFKNSNHNSQNPYPPENTLERVDPQLRLLSVYLSVNVQQILFYCNKI